MTGVSSLSRESLCKALLGERSGDFVILLISVRAHSRRTSCPPPRTDGRHHSGRVECSCDLPFSATGETRLEKRVDGGKLETDCGPAWPRSDRRLEHRIDQYRDLHQYIRTSHVSQRHATFCCRPLNRTGTNDWSTKWPALITLVGWLFLLGGLIRMIAPVSSLQAVQHPATVLVLTAALLGIGIVLTFNAYR